MDKLKYCVRFREGKNKGLEKSFFSPKDQIEDMIRICNLKNEVKTIADQMLEIF